MIFGCKGEKNMNVNETDLQQETSRSPVLDGVSRNIQAARKFLEAGGSRQAIEDYEKDERVIAASLNDLNDRKADKTELNALTEVVNTKASQADMTAVQQDIADIKGTDADTSSANSITRPIWLGSSE